jgi:hypothetical protein
MNRYVMAINPSRTGPASSFLLLFTVHGGYVQRSMLLIIVNYYMQVPTVAQGYAP